MKTARVILKFLPLLTAILIVSCSQEEPQKRVVENVDKKEDTGAMLPDVKADRMLVVDLEGMVCKMGCGGTIREALYASNAVKEVSFDFEEDRKVDVAKVAYDRDKITADEIVGIIAAANEGQFNVINTRSEPFVETAATPTDESSDLNEPVKEKSKVSIKTSYKPVSSGLFDLFSWF